MSKYKITRIIIAILWAVISIIHLIKGDKTMAIIYAIPALFFLLTSFIRKK